jgi:multicomponent Na+:H+ antiporter subunit G
MIDFQLILVIIFVLSGIFFMTVGSIGILRLPDFVARTHAISKSDTLGIILVITGLIIHEGFGFTSAKLFLVVLFIALANPIGSHALVLAAIKKGIKPIIQNKGNNTTSEGDK